LTLDIEYLFGGTSTNPTRRFELCLTKKRQKIENCDWWGRRKLMPLSIY